MSHKIFQSTFWAQVFRRRSETAKTKGVHSFFQSSFWTQVFIVALFAFSAHVFMSGLGLNIVMRDYCFGGRYFLQGVDPYKATESRGSSDSFAYSPLFALVAGGIARELPAVVSDMRIQQVATQGFWLFVQAPGQQPQFATTTKPALFLGLWVLVSAALFALGLRRWCDLSRPAPFYMIVAFLAAMLDMVISTGVYQINAIVIGIMLLGLAEYRDGRYYTAGALLMLAANLKIYPVIFLAALLLRFRWKYWIGAFIGGVIIFILPAFWVGWTFNFNTHLEWVRVVLTFVGHERILDIIAAFERAGLALFGNILHKTVFVISLAVFGTYAAASKRMDWRPWMAFGVAAILLLSPRAEVYTYVMLAPAYVYLFYWSRESEFNFIKKYGAIIVTLLGVASASVRFIDPKWYHSQEPWEMMRVLSALGFWIFTGTVLVLSLHKSFRERLAARNSAAA